jgi:hypothetical protein
MSYRLLLACLLLAVTPASAAAAAPLWGLERPKITGTMDVGQQLACSDGKWQYALTAISKRWTRAGQTVATGNAYTVQAVDGDAGTGDAVNGGADRLVMIAGTGRASLSAWNPATLKWNTAALKLTNAWKRNGKAIKGQTSSRYTVRRADRRKRLTCSVTAKNAGGARTVTARAVKIK